MTRGDLVAVVLVCALALAIVLFTEALVDLLCAVGAQPFTLLYRLTGMDEWVTCWRTR